VQDPEIYHTDLKVELPCAVDPSRPAIVDAAHRALVNHEVYFFSSPEALRTFSKDPLRYCGRLTDPVSGVRFQPTRSSPKAVYEGRPYYFHSAANRRMFQASPEKYEYPVRRMPD
jgi:YHS domain-containing protein